MKNYERDQRTGTVTISDGAEKRGKDQVKLPRCRWYKKVTKYGQVKYRMLLPTNLFGFNNGVFYKFDDRYDIKKSNAL
jgi:hypothetical protein